MLIPWQKTRIPLPLSSPPCKWPSIPSVAANDLSNRSHAWVSAKRCEPCLDEHRRLRPVDRTNPQYELSGLFRSVVELVSSQKCEVGPPDVHLGSRPARARR